VSGSDSDLDQDGWDQDRTDAEARGLRILDGNPQRLLLDLDDEAAFARFKRVYKRAKELFGFRDAFAWPSKSGLPHRHVAVDLERPASVEARLALQAVLGSDPILELLNLKRHDNGVEEPTMLFEPRETDAVLLAGWIDDEDDGPPKRENAAPFNRPRKV
jgi:hypothetical protein